MKRPAASLRGLASIALMAAVLEGCFDDDCPEDETVQVHMAGTCAAEPRTFSLVQRGCSLRVTVDGQLELPRAGALDQARHPIRKGGWQLYGYVCPEGEERCDHPIAFRRCTARRVDWQLDLTCVDASEAPVCQATLTE